MRKAKIDRKTLETNVSAEVNIDGTGRYNITTGIGFLNHMIEQLSRHSLIDINMQVSGDLHIDGHHSVEDSAIVLGDSINQALGSRQGIQRFASATIAMDEALTRVVVDCSNRPYLVWKVVFTKEKLGDMDTELFKEWFHAFANSAGITIHVENFYGNNNHHIAESCFKALARSLASAFAINPLAKDIIASTKGVLAKTSGI